MVLFCSEKHGPSTGWNLQREVVWVVTLGLLAGMMKTWWTETHRSDWMLAEILSYL
jgi:hypothetical protein